MLVSIIITNYNYGAYLRDAIDSALAQRHARAEVIVVDDGSTDDSRAIIAGYGDRIVPIYKRNGGQCSCFNDAFRRSKGDVIVFLDADDVLLENAVALHVQSFRDPTVVKSNGYLQITDQNLRPIGGRIPSRLAPSGVYRQRFLRRGPRAYESSFTSGNAWSRDFLVQVMPLPATPWFGADGYLTAVDQLFGRIVSIGQVIGRYRLHDANKGPLGVGYGRDYLRRRLQRYEHRLAYAAYWAERLGYRVEAAQWDKWTEWRLALARQALYLYGDRATAPTLAQVAGCALRSPGPWRPYKNIAVFCVLSLAKILPRRPALDLANRLLHRSWNRHRSCIAASAHSSSAGQAVAADSQ